MKLFSIKSPNWTKDLALLFIRLSFGSMMIIHHGLKKLKNFDGLKDEFFSFMGLSSSLSLSLAIFGEFFCAILLIIGLASRWATIPLMITMLVAMSIFDFSITGEKHIELALLFFTAFLSIALMGPGKYSVDGLISKGKK